MDVDAIHLFLSEQAYWAIGRPREIENMSDSLQPVAASKIPERLFIFEMANNHMGDVEHGLR